MTHFSDACVNLVSAFEFQDIRSADPPKNKEVYVIRVVAQGEPVLKIVQNVGIKNILESVAWPQVTKYVQSRINRLLRVDECPLIYVGSAAPGENSSNTLRGRYQEFANRHTAMYPIWALLHFGWHLEFGWHESDLPKAAEVELKEKYKSLHDGRLPALVEREILGSENFFFLTNISASSKFQPRFDRTCIWRNSQIEEIRQATQQGRLIG